MRKKYLGAAVLAPLLALTLVMPVLASDGGQSKEFKGKPPIWARLGWTLKWPDRLYVRPLDPACMSAAVDKRDTAIIAALDAKTAALKQALEARREALKAAWLLTDTEARREALKAAWQNYGRAVSEARKTFRDGKHAAWDQFRLERKACGTEDPGQEDDESADAQL